MYRDAVAAEAIKASAPAKEGKKGKKTSKDTDKDPGKRASSKCAVLGNDLPKGLASKKPKAAPSATNKVLARQDGTNGTFTKSATLDNK